MSNNGHGLGIPQTALRGNSFFCSLDIMAEMFADNISNIVRRLVGAISNLPTNPNEVDSTPSSCVCPAAGCPFSGIQLALIDWFQILCASTSTSVFSGRVIPSARSRRFIPYARGCPFSGIQLALNDWFQILCASTSTSAFSGRVIPSARSRRFVPYARGNAGWGGEAKRKSDNKVVFKDI